MVTRDSQETTGLSSGAIVGIVVGLIAFVCLKLAVVYLVCWRRRVSGRIQKSSPLKPRPERRPRRQDRQQNLDTFLEMLKEYEFDCRDIEVCVDADGNDIQLGTGGFGCVILGARNGVQPVAIKQMLHTDQKAKEDFLNEIQLLKHVSLDANVLQYYGATIKDDYLWLVTEYMQGGDLRQALSADNDSQLNWWNGGKQIAVDIAKGLAFLHSRNVIHRDIKSQNILLTREGRAKIADVGMAQMISDASSHARVAQQQGTFAWAAPEILVKESRCTEKVDIYSFGVCLWEIVTSQMPQRGEMFCPSADSCPASVITLIHECMKINPEDRPSAKEICRRLSACDPPDFEGLLDSAEAGGRRSHFLPPGLQGRGQGWSGQSLPEPRHPLPVFRYDSPMSTMGDDMGHRSNSNPAASLELVSRARKGLDIADPSVPPLGQSQSQGGRTRQGEIQDDKVECTSASPRFYRPGLRAVPPRKSRWNTMDIQPGILETEEGEESGEDGDGSGAVLDTQDSLPQSNSAFSQLVARYSEREKTGGQGWRRESEDTNILSSMDADASHIPSLHNTFNLTGDINQMLESHSLMTTEESRNLDVWQNQMESSHDLFTLGSRGSTGGPLHPDQQFLTSEDIYATCHDRETCAESGESSEDELDELERGAVESVQGFAGSVTSSIPQSELHVTPRLESYSSNPEPEDNTSHHLEVPRLRPRSPQATREGGEGESTSQCPSSFLATETVSMSSIYRTGSSIYHSLDILDGSEAGSHSGDEDGTP